MALKQEMLVEISSDLYGPAEIIAEYDDLTLEIVRFIIKASKRKMLVGINLTKGKVQLTKDTIEADKTITMPQGIHFIKSLKDDGFEFERGLNVTFYSKGS